MDTLAACRNCPIGAAHAGRAFVQHASMFGQRVCPRCRRGTTRMIKNRVCVGCYNRERELRSGRNARGNAPRELQTRPLHRLAHMRLSVDGHPSRADPGEVVDTFEAMMQVHRTTVGRIDFGFRGWEGGLRQARLF